jgi:hypothetical protein
MKTLKITSPLTVRCPEAIFDILYEKVIRKSKQFKSRTILTKSPKNLLIFQMRNFYCKFYLRFDFKIKFKNQGKKHQHQHEFIYCVAACLAVKSKIKMRFLFIPNSIFCQVLFHTFIFPSI